MYSYVSNNSHELRTVHELQRFSRESSNSRRYAEDFHFPKISKFDQIFALVVWRSFFFKMSQFSSSDGICKNQPGAQAARGEETGPAGAGTIFANAEKRDLAEVGGAAQ